MRKIVAIFILFLLAAGSCQAVKLYKIRFGYYPERIRAVFDFDGSFEYQTLEESKEKIVLLLKNTAAGPEIPNYAELNDLVVRYFEFEKEGDNLKVTIPLNDPIAHSVFSLNDPPRLVVDFSRNYLNIVSGGSVCNGVEFLNVRKGSPDGPVTASVLKVDPRKAEVEPVLAKKAKPNVLQSFVNFLLPWTRKEVAEEQFYLDKLTTILDDSGAVAGVNGTYFAYNGRPLGALMINRELVTAPLYDRTAFFLDEANQPYIDNIFTSCYFRLADGTRYKIDSMNEGREKNETVLFSSVWGTRTATDSQGIELVIRNSAITEINSANSKIPYDGYVISINGPEVESLSAKVKVGDKIDAHIKVIPYASSPKNIVHLVSGGPRLLKNGIVYVSKNEEKFKKDIARGRAARTAVGITRQGELLFVTVDGFSKKKEAPRKSIGATLEELSNLMLSLGAIEAMNLDGGSSSTMVVDNRVVNNPTAGSQRSISNAIVIRPRS